MFNAINYSNKYILLVWLHNINYQFSHNRMQFMHLISFNVSDTYFYGDLVKSLSPLFQSIPILSLKPKHKHYYNKCNTVGHIHQVNTHTHTHSWYTARIEGLNCVNPTRDPNHNCSIMWSISPFCCVWLDVFLSPEFRTLFLIDHKMATQPCQRIDSHSNHPKFQRRVCFEKGMADKRRKMASF